MTDAPTPPRFSRPADVARSGVIFPKGTPLLITVSALGYFVDVFDLLLFSVVRQPSLSELGLNQADTLRVGLMLLNWQMAGLLAGGFFWGMLGDRRGRASVLFGSILVYSLANLANAFVSEVWQYEGLRFLAGFGLAGELGAGVTLVSEVMSTRHRGVGTVVVASVGVLGAVAAGLTGALVHWRTAYVIGGVMGLALLLLRAGFFESGLFASVRRAPEVVRGSIRQLVWPPQRFSRFLKCVLVGLPTYFVIGILITLAPEFGIALGLPSAPVAGTAVIACYLGLAMGDVVCSAFSQIVRSRRMAFLACHLVGAVTIAVYLFHRVADLRIFYWSCFGLGAGIGCWALVVTNAAEQFGTNLRATATTAVPNLVRAALLPISWIFGLARDSFGLIGAAAAVGAACVLIAIGAVIRSEETFDRSLDFLEKP